jgi:hypothetical protein
MSFPFDPSLYGTVPTRTPGATLSLARGLISAAATKPDAAITRRIAKIRKSAKLLQTAWVEAGRPSASGEDPRPYDVTLDRCWAALRTRLEGCVQLGDDDHAPRAGVMLSTIYPNGLDFLRLSYPEEWAESERRLEMVKKDKLAKELEELAGAPYLPAIKKAHAAYGTVLGITDKKAPAVESVRVAKPLRELQAAIGAYVRAVVGQVEEDDEESVAAAQEQLEPLVRAKRPRGSAEPEEPIEAPLPEAPAEGAA